MSTDGPRALSVAARTLAVDAVTVEVVEAWRERGIDSILIKGSTVAAWLYGDDGARGYGDADLLVPPERQADACGVLERLGFVELARPHPWVSWHATAWLRERDQAVVDLHRWLYGCERSAQHQWRVLTGAWVERSLLHGTSVRVPVPAARALLVALHAEQHMELRGKPLEDLRRALARASDEQWEAASLLADDLGALRRMVAGLQLLPEGAPLVRRLPVLRAELAPSPDRSVVVAAVRWRRARGAHAKARVIARGLGLAPSTLREHSSLARRGRVGLVLATVQRIARILSRSRHIPLVWRRSR